MGKPSFQSPKAVYCIASRLPWGADFAFKFGIAEDPWRRVAEMQTGNPLEMRVVTWLGPVPPDEARRVEAGIHTRLSEQRIRNSEWFDGGSGLVRVFVSEMDRMREDFEQDSRVWDRTFDRVLDAAIAQEMEGR